MQFVQHIAATVLLSLLAGCSVLCPAPKSCTAPSAELRQKEAAAFASIVQKLRQDEWQVNVDVESGAVVVAPQT